MGKVRAYKFISLALALALNLQLAMLTLLPIHVSAATVVTFPDSNLEAVIRTALSKPAGDILDTELATLSSLTGSSQGIVNLSGLEYCTNLTSLTLDNNSIVNLAPLAALTNLTQLNLHHNLYS